MELFQKPEFWLIVLTAASEIIGMSKLKDNSIVELVLSMTRKYLPSMVSSHTPSRKEGKANQAKRR